MNIFNVFGLMQDQGSPPEPLSQFQPNLAQNGLKSKESKINK